MVQEGRLTEIGRRVASASVGPWAWQGSRLLSGDSTIIIGQGVGGAYHLPSDVDMGLIENARVDLEFLLSLVADLEEQLTYTSRRLGDAEQLYHQAQAAAGKLGPALQHMVTVQPALDRAAKLEAALEVVAAREVINSMARQELAALVTLAHDAWGIIAAAENFKYTLVDGHSEPVGPQEWRNAAVEWRDRFHALTGALRPQDAPGPADPHAMCASEVVKIRGERDRLADELERLRGLIRSMEHDHATQQSRWQPQILELAIERDAANRDRQAAELEAARLREENAQLEAARAEASIAQVQYHAQMRKQITDAHEDTNRAVEQRDAAAARADENAREASRLGQEMDRLETALVNAERAKRENDERFQLQIRELEEELHILRSSDSLEAVAYAAGLGTHPRPCNGYMLDGDRFIFCDQQWPHPRVDPGDGRDTYEHCNAAEGVHWNQHRAPAPAHVGPQTTGWTFGQVRQFVAAHPDWSNDQPVQACVPERPREWAYDGSGVYQHRLLGLAMDDPREFLE